MQKVFGKFRATSTAADLQPLRLQHFALRGGLSLGLALVFAWLLSGQIQGVNWSQIADTLAQIDTVQICLALGFTGLSYWAIGHYDAVIHRHFATGENPRVARKAGICAIALSQIIGMGLISGSIMRWRMLPDRGLGFATKITAAVTVSFLAGWAIITTACLLFAPGAPHKEAAMIAFYLIAIVILTCTLAPRRLAKAWHLPNGLTLGQLVFFCAIDTFAAGTALYVLLPQATALGLSDLLPAFLIAFGLGLISGSPGGIGAFEVVLLAYVPSVDVAVLLAAVMAWRLVYFVVPALYGTCLAVYGPGKMRAHLPVAPFKPHTARSTCSEGQLQQQEGFEYVSLTQNHTWLIAKTRHFLVGFFDPNPSDDPSLKVARPLLPDVAQQTACIFAKARAQNRIGLMYKSGGRSAAAARAMGAHPLRVARNGWLDPRAAPLNVPARAKLRRKLRKAAAAGVSVTYASHKDIHRLWPQLRLIAQNWEATHGRERGFSMGRFCPATLLAQRVFIAWHGDRVVGFVSFHTTGQGWTLDVMRHDHCVPDGTMHLIVQTAIEDAAQIGVARVSLAAVPEPCFADAAQPKIAGTMRKLGLLNSGLLQFKSCFAPQWQPLYIVAPNRICLILGLAAIARAVFLPSPLRPEQGEDFQDDVAEYEFASGAQKWHRQGETIID